ncbi:hypothetical protein BC939DRAFT_476652 [Gamsiella multidivaricata]|uniref:uncharacterized protein n=1 Tax=Gamsiella multidivaricata TaxID=101098 RepID=UPI00221F56D4|nr:uncharacterized protein BC939DRAFT_476652 [Gamsiella multidivaricata]KAG0371385.1 hypothetical protein BGZ54_000012 [Gamsiella multidivaricata]KAI7824680.1 hypothetical protein BC939DRAFT_476652 [Gamsiella multidivaricata]
MEQAEIQRQDKDSDCVDNVGEEQEEQAEQEHDRYKNNPELLGEHKPKATRLFSFDWASGFVSPFRPTPEGILSKLLSHVDFSGPESGTLLDLGCGDGLVLVQALKAFPRSQLRRAVGVDLDRELLDYAKGKILRNNDDGRREGDDDGQEYGVLGRLELYHGDLTTRDEALSVIMTPTAADHGAEIEGKESMTMRILLDECSHIFVYLLPEALSKLAGLLKEAVERRQKVVLSMRWEIPELRGYQVHGGVDLQYYVYKLV